MLFSMAATRRYFRYGRICLANILILCTFFLGADCHTAQTQRATASASPAEAASSLGGGALVTALPPQRAPVDDSIGLQPFGWVVLILFACMVGAFALLRQRGLAGALSVLGVQRLDKPSRSAAPIVTGRTALSPQLVVYALKWGNEELLIGGTTQSVSLLARRPYPPVDHDQTE